MLKQGKTWFSLAYEPRDPSITKTITENKTGIERMQ